tara:strand:- start:638 stop:1090 length:453 start_codon:yes stop_codon:yes gene_type:complete
MHSGRLLCYLALGGLLPLCSCAAVDGAAAEAGQQELHFELLGSWFYSGATAALSNTLEISADELLEIGDYMGSGWVAQMDILSWDNEADQLGLELVEVEGQFYPHRVGDLLYLSWRLEEDSMRLYTSTVDFLLPEGGTEGDEFMLYSPVR